MNPQYPQNPQTPGYGAPQPQPQQPMYPTPGYGAPQQPAYPPTPGYGAPQQPSQYPGYGAPPSQYPGYGAPQQPGYPVGYGYGPPPTGNAFSRMPQQQRRVVIIGVIAGVVLLGLIIGLIVRYNGPVSVSKDFVQNVFDLNSADALKDVCTDSSASSTKLRQEMQALGALNPTGKTFSTDISGLTFTTVSESLSQATVSFTGSVVAPGSSGAQQTHGTLTLNASGLWWCVTDTPA